MLNFSEEQRNRYPPVCVGGGGGGGLPSVWDRGQTVKIPIVLFKAIS